MEKFQEIFNNRELATLFWIAIIGIFIQFYHPTRKASKEVFRAFFKLKIIIVIALAILFSTSIVGLLWAIKFWENSLLKDTIYWFMGSGFLIIMSLNKVSKQDDFFKNLFTDNLKLILILEFVINFHQFSLLIEIIILPVLTFLVMVQTVAGREERTKNVKIAITWILLIITGFFLSVSIRDIINDLEGFSNYSNLKSFLLPIILSISFIPFAYLLALYMKYENIFVRLDLFLINKNNLQYTKLRIIRKSGLRMSRLNFFSNQINTLHNGSTREEIKNIIS